MQHFNKTDLADLQNVMSLNDYFNRLCEMALSCFKWDGLPDEVDPTRIERELLFRGQCLFFKDDILDEYMCLPFVGKNRFDINGYPLEREAFSHFNDYRTIRSKTDSVIIFNNKLHTPYTINLWDFARRLYECDRTMDVNMQAQKTPVLITGKEKQMLALKNTYKKYVGNEPVIYADKDFDAGAVTVLKTDAPYLCDKIWNTKTNIWNEALTYLGVSNVSIEKRERLVSDEVERNQGGTIVNCNIRFSERKLACERINKMFGLNVSVSFNYDYTADNEKGEEISMKEVIDE